MYTDRTVIISCAGMGTRLGMGMPKALVDLAGKPLVIRQLELLNNVEDVRIVVGYQAEKVIEVVQSYRKDIIFCFNYDYKTTGTGASFSKGLLGARKWVVALDGDLLVTPEDLKIFFEMQEECIGGCEPSTDNPVLMDIDERGYVKNFSREHGQLEWTGLALMKREKLIPGKGHVYQMLENLLPLKAVNIRTREIDTINDYERAIDWIKNEYKK